MEAATTAQHGADGLVPGQEPREYERVVRTAVSAGQLLTAIEVAREGLERFGETGGLRQQLALALVQTGALAAAREVLAEHPPLLADVDGLLERLAARDSGGEAWQQAGRDFEAFASRLLAHERNENAVVQEGYNEDLGLAD